MKRPNVIERPHDAECTITCYSHVTGAACLCAPTAAFLHLSAILPGFLMVNVSHRSLPNQTSTNTMHELHNERFSDFPEFDESLSLLSNLLFEINGDISTLQQFLETLESGIANGKSIEKITSKSMSNIDKTTLKMSDLKFSMDNLVKMDNSQLDNQRIISKEKILRDVNFSVNEFKVCQNRLKRFNEKLNNENKAALLQEEEAHLVQLPVSASTLQANGSTNKMQMIVERHDSSQLGIEYQNNMIQQRDQEISRIESGILDINSIFKDLNSLVVEQGQMINTIESNIYNVETNVKLGSQELTRALEYQRKKSKLCFYLFFFLFMLLLVTIMFTF